jgi:hypothetical protein
MTGEEKCVSTDNLPIESNEPLSITRALSGRWHDVAGIMASAACAVHCAMMPVALGYLPTLGLSWLADEAFHRLMAVVCFLLAALAFLPGWRRHGSCAPAAFGSIGVALLATGAFVFPEPCCANCQQDLTQLSVEVKNCSDWTVAYGKLAIRPWLTPLGGAILVAGHFINHRCSRGCCREP